LVVSNAAPLRFLYTEVRGWPQWRAGLVEKIEVALATMLRVNHVSYRLPQVARLIAFTEFLKNWYVSHGIFPKEKIDVVPIYLPEPACAAAPKSNPDSVGFIAKDFDAKGGATLLAAWEIVRGKRPDARLTIVGCPPRLSAEQAAGKGIQWFPYLDRAKLLAEIMPNWDVFAYPTEFDGLPLVVLEAMSLGIPVAISDYQAMPEIIGGAGMVAPAGDAAELGRCVLQLLEPEANCRGRAAAFARFRGVFSAGVAGMRLRRVYEAAIRGYNVRG
jgi:glycosyltransferase involved in cell wall biosynthesis